MTKIDKIIDTILDEYDCLNRTKENCKTTLQLALSEALSKAGLIRREVDGLRIHEIIDNNMPLPENLRVRDWEYEDIDVIAQALKSAIESGEVFKKGQCQDDWHLGWQCLAEKYGDAEAGKRYKPYRSCPSACGAKVIPGD